MTGGGTALDVRGATTTDATAGVVVVVSVEGGVDEGADARETGGGGVAAACMPRRGSSETTEGDDRAWGSRVADGVTITDGRSVLASAPSPAPPPTTASRCGGDGLPSMVPVAVGSAVSSADSGAERGSLSVVMGRRAIRSSWETGGRLSGVTPVDAASGATTAKTGGGDFPFSAPEETVLAFSNASNPEVSGGAVGDDDDGMPDSGPACAAEKKSTLGRTVGAAPCGDDAPLLDPQGTGRA